MADVMAYTSGSINESAPHLLTQAGAWPNRKDRFDMTNDTATAPKRLWEIDHPYYAAEGYLTTFDTFDELKHSIDQMDEDMNYVYRWDWFDAAAEHNADLYADDEPRTEQYLTVTTVMQRKSNFAQFRCPIRHDQEADVLAWLHSDRIAGHLRKTWAPILDTNETGPLLDLSNLRSDVDYWRNRALAAERHVERLESRA